MDVISPQTWASLEYAAAVLKFSAVPATGFELISESRREAVEGWLVEKLPRLVAGLGLALGILFVAVLLLVKAGPYLVLIYLVFQRQIGWLLYLGIKDTGMLMALSFGLGILVTIVAAVEKWLLPESWILALAYPFEYFSVRANAIPYLGWILPDYSAQAFLEHFRHVFQAVEDWLWPGIRWMAALYFFFARGFMLLTVIAIQLLFLVCIVLGALLALALPAHLFMRASDWVKRRLQLPSRRIPIGAFVLWAAGETLEFALKTIPRLAGAS